MGALEILTRLKTLLDEEREAVARLDGASVARFAAEKTALAKALEQTTTAERAPHADLLKRVVLSLKANGVLLAQARGILAEFLLGPGHTFGPGSRSLRPASSARHVSVRG